MDPNRGLFSRGSVTPPQNSFSSQSQQSQPRNVSTSMSTLESLFSSIPLDAGETKPADSTDSLTPTASSILSPTTAPAPDPANPPSTGSNAERQNALLNMLGASASPQFAPVQTNQSPVQQQPVHPTQIPTPPGSVPAPRSDAGSTRSEQQGKALLDQLMGTSKQSRSSFDNGSGGAPSPTFNVLSPSHRPNEFLFGPHEMTAEPVPLPQRLSPPHQPPPPPQQPPKSMFEFVSPFDALSATTTQQKQKPSQPAQPAQSAPQPPSQPPSADESMGSWSAISDPKRHSVDNLLETLTRGSSYVPGPVPSYDVHQMLSPHMQHAELQPLLPSTRGALPVLPTQQQSQPQQPQPKPNHPGSPRFSPPRAQASPRQQEPIKQQVQQQQKREKEGSPVPRGSGFRRPPGNNKATKTTGSPGPQVQSIVFDVSQNQHEVQAGPEFVKSTPIALVRQDTVFLPGTTIGATHWVAYAMTRGRVRVISRSSGDRTLLQLPSTFPTSASVTDMAVHSNRLAGVTSDGGFVLWELPDVVTDDVPGTLILHVPPSPNAEPLHSVKWHPRDPETLAVASDHKVYIIDLTNTQVLSGQPLPQSELHRLGPELHIPSPLVALDFDTIRHALATISEDSTLMLWNLEDRIPYSTYKIRGEDVPTSLTFVEGGMVVGRKNGTIFQLLSLTSKTVTATLSFTNNGSDDPDMFGHINYDARIQTLWIANCKRSGLIAVRIGYESYGGDEVRGYFDQLVEFPGPKPTIHFVILSGDADPNGDEALAATVAAKEPPGELALVAFSVHSSGVDQVLIRKEWYDHALMTNVSKFPVYPFPLSTTQVQPSIIPISTQSEPHPPTKGQQRGGATAIAPLQPAPVRTRTPPSDDVAEEAAREREDVRETRGKGRGKNANWKDKEKEDKERTKALEAGPDPGITQTISKEIRKSEDSLATRLSRLISKEMDKQQQRLEEDRVTAQSESIANQEKILNLISSELTRNTQRVVESAVKAEISRSVLPSLEKITKTEVKAALSEHMGKGLNDYLGQTLPLEIERIFRRPDMSNTLAGVFTSTIGPVIENNVKDVLSQTVIPVVTQQATSLHSEMMHEMRSELYRVKSDLTAWQSDAFRSQEKTIRALEHHVLALTDQVKYLAMNAPAPLPMQQPIQHLQSGSQGHSSPGSGGHVSGSLSQTHLRNQPIPPVLPAPLTYSSSTFSQASQQPQTTWYSPSNIAAPKASHPASLPQPPSEKEQTPPIKSDQWDDAYLTVLHTEDPSKLKDLLSRTNADVIMPLHGPSLVSQAVILTLVHRLSTLLGESSPADESFKSSLWWLQRSVAVLDPSDKLISDFIPRVVPSIQKSLNSTRQRITILPGGPLTIDTARNVADVSETLRRKVQAAA